VPKGDVEVKGFDVEWTWRPVVLAKADFEGSDLGTLNTDVLPKAFGVVARLEKADFCGLRWYRHCVKWIGNGWGRWFSVTLTM